MVSVYFFAFLMTVLIRDSILFLDSILEKVRPFDHAIVSTYA